MFIREIMNSYAFNDKAALKPNNFNVTGHLMIKIKHGQFDLEGKKCPVVASNL